MPWKIERREGRYCVIKEDDGDNEGCHDTREEAERQMRALYATENRAAVDNTEWDGNAAMSSAKTAADYRAICAGEKSVGEPDERIHWALPHHKRPGSPPNAAGVRNALARLPQTQGLKNAGAARSHLQAHMSAISGDSENRGEMDTRLPIEMRSASVGEVNFPQRLIEVVAVPYEQEAVVEYRGELWNESFDRGSFNGVETRSGKIKAYRDHDPLTASKSGLVGKAIAFDPDSREGLAASVKIAKTSLGDDTLNLADEGVLGVSVGFGVRGSDQVLDRAARRRRIKKAFLDHLAFPDNGAYEGAQIIGVRRQRSQAADLPRLETPLLDDVVAWMESRKRRA